MYMSNNGQFVKPPPSPVFLHSETWKRLLNVEQVNEIVTPFRYFKMMFDNGYMVQDQKTTIFHLKDTKENLEIKVSVFLNPPPPTRHSLYLLISTFNSSSFFFVAFLRSGRHNHFSTREIVIRSIQNIIGTKHFQPKGTRYGRCKQILYFA